MVQIKAEYLDFPHFLKMIKNKKFSIFIIIINFEKIQLIFYIFLMIICLFLIKEIDYKLSDLI